MHFFIAGSWDAPENEVFRRIAVEKGIPEQKVLVEQRATNLGEKMANSHEILRMNGITPSSVILVTMPFMERRVYATFMKQWPDYFLMKEMKVVLKSPPIKLLDYPVPQVGNLNEVICMVVGTLQRIREYPITNHQIKQKIPNDIWSAYKELVTSGKYTDHLLWKEEDSDKSGDGA